MEVREGGKEIALMGPETVIESFRDHIKGQNGPNKIRLFHRRVI